MKKNILAIVPALMPSVNIGIINPMQYLQQKGEVDFKVTLPYVFQSKMLDNIDCVIFCRNSFPNEEWILNEVASRGIPYIYEIDDNFFEIPYDNELGRNHRHPVNLSSFINFISHASVVRTYSHFLAEDVGFYNKNIEMNRVYFDFELITELKQNKSDKLKIVYATSRMADAQQDIFTEALHKIALNYQNNVEIYFWGAPITDKELKTLSNVFHLAPIYNYEKFIKKFYEMGFDIGLAPIFEGRFFNSKTNNKYREYGACKIAGIYSNEDLYSDCVVDGKNGLLVQNTPDGWYKAIEKLVLDRELRNTIIEQANSDIEKNYSFEHYCDIWMLSIEKAIAQKPFHNQLESYWKKNTHINMVILQELNIEDEQLSKVKQKLISDIYNGSRVCIVSNIEIYKDEMNKSEIYLKNSKNILLIANDKKRIEYFDNYASKNKINIILLTSLSQDTCNTFKSLNCLSIIEKDTTVFSNYKNNIYLDIDYMIKKLFKQTTNLSFRDRFVVKVLSMIKQNWFIQKILFLIEKKNSIKLRVYTWWKIYKINKESKK